MTKEEYKVAICNTLSDEYWRGRPEIVDVLLFLKDFGYETNDNDLTLAADEIEDDYFY